jgi:hypothetical protein
MSDGSKTNRRSNNLSSIQEPITSASPQVKEIIEQVLKLEKEKLYLKVPRNINEDVLNIIKKVIQ